MSKRAGRLQFSRRELLGASGALAHLLLGCRSPGGPSERAAPSTTVPRSREESAVRPSDGASRADAAPSAEPPLVERSVDGKKIYLQVFGAPLPSATLPFLTNAIRLYFPFELELLPVRPLPSEAYYPPRRRYRAEKLLDALEALAPEDAQVVVGLTSVDISTTKGEYEDWGVLGLATLDGRECVISEFRAKRGARSAAHTRERLAKTVVHEIGHTIGLPHCPNHGCIMEDGKGTVTTTDHEADICGECRARVGALLRPVPESLPWPRP